MGQRGNTVIAFCWIGLSLFVLIGAHGLGLGDFRNPQEGLMPFLLGITLFLVGLAIAGKAWTLKPAENPGRQEAPAGTGNFLKIGVVFGSILAYALLLEKLGFLAATSLLLIVLFRTSGQSRWSSVLISSGLAMAGIHVVFSLLGVGFPQGIFFAD